MENNVLKFLPGFNCGACGFSSCKYFAQALLQKKSEIENCTVLHQDRFKRNRNSLLQFVLNLSFSEKTDIKGLIDKAKADFLLHALPNESSCRETLLCFATVHLENNMLIRYRPLGCPITHFARIIQLNNGLLDVWVVGPCKLLNIKEEAFDIGICMILSFQGVIEGVLPEIGQTVKFLPANCMMGKIHSGIIVQLEEKVVRIDCIDLKIWEHAEIE